MLAHSISRDVVSTKTTKELREKLSEAGADLLIAS
jgi:hypothetical protein